MTHTLKILLSIMMVGMIGFAKAESELPAKAYAKQWPDNFITDVKRDFSNYLKIDTLLPLGKFFITAGVLANTGLDKSIAHHWQKDIRSKKTNAFFALPKIMGGLCFYYVPLYFGPMLIGHYRDESLPGNVLYHFGYRGLRTVLLGGVQQAVFTHILGSDRPCKKTTARWRPFKHCTGVSGHAFYGAVPFLSAAMMSDPPLLRYGLYVASTLPGISRINSDAHYLSQVILGWSLAFLSARSVYQSDGEREPAYQVGIYPRSDGAMLSAQLRF